MKSQGLADFIADFSLCSLPQAEKELMTLGESPNREGTRMLHVDRFSNFKGSELGLVLTSLNGDKLNNQSDVAST